MARLDIVRKATACCAVLAAFAAAGCSAGQSSSAARLAPGAVASSAGSGHSPGAKASGSAAQGSSSGGSGTAGSSSQASAPSSDGSPTAFGSPTPTGTPSPVASNITVAPAGSMQKGPMKITPVYCGQLSAAQQSQFGTNAAGGLIYKYANTGAGAVSGSAKLYVGFTAGSGILGSNYAGAVPDVAPGKSGLGEVDAVDIQGRDLSFTGCEIMSYSLVTSMGVDPVSYAG